MQISFSLTLPCMNGVWKQREQERQSRQGRIEGYPLTGLPPFPSRLEGVKTSERVGGGKSHHLSAFKRVRTQSKSQHANIHAIMDASFVRPVCCCVVRDIQISPMWPRLQQDQCYHTIPLACEPSGRQRASHGFRSLRPHLITLVWRGKVQ